MPVRTFTDAYPAVGDVLDEYYFKCKAARWKSLADMRQSFNSVDFVGNDRYVFNSKDNHYHLVAMVFFNRRTLYIRFISAHTGYDAVDVTTI